MRRNAITAFVSFCLAGLAASAPARADAIADFFDGDSPRGLFHPRATCPAAQALVLTSLDRVLSPGDRAACEGDPGREGVGVA